ncbi:MAG: hypothetical protein NTW86_17390 [Candidatus Sumerlaeota bacterium]|nr:hypothetical protein [Candidatus Sumerlaeota bacterium]
MNKSVSTHSVARCTFLCLALSIGGAAMAAEEKPLNLLEDRGLWKPVAANRLQKMSWDKAGNLVLLSDAPDRELQCSLGRKQALAGARLRFDMRFVGSPAANTAGGIRFDGMATPKGEALTVLIEPMKERIQIGDTTQAIQGPDEDPCHFDVEMAFSGKAIQVFWRGKPFAEAPAACVGDAAGIIALVREGTMSVGAVSVSAAPQSAQAARAAREYSNVALDLNASTMTAIPSQWPDYFGTHYASSPEMAGIAWNTVRSYGGPHAGIAPDESERNQDDPVRKGPFTGKDIRVGVRDFHSQGARKEGARTAEDFVPELLAHHITDINIMTNIVKPSMEPFDKDLAYWTIRSIHEKFPESRHVLYWEMGNEIVSGHFDPMGLKAGGKAPRVGADGKVFGYDIDWKCDFYVNQYLAPAVEAVERAAQDVYGDPRAIEILVGSMNPYNDYNKKFLKKLMDSTFDGKQAPTLKGDPTWKHFDLLNVHYMTGSDENMRTMQEYLDEYVKTGKTKGIWVSEDHGGGGKGPVTLIDRGLRFMAWVAKNGLTADQTRVVWWGEAERAGGSGKDVTAALGEFFKGRRLFFQEKREKAMRYYVVSDAADKGVARILVAALPDPSGFTDLGVLTLALPGNSAAREWKAEATQYSSLVPPETVAAEMSRAGANLNVLLNRRITEPFVVWLTGNE